MTVITHLILNTARTKVDEPQDIDFDDAEDILTALVTSLGITEPNTLITLAGTDDSREAHFLHLDTLNVVQISLVENGNDLHFYVRSPGDAAPVSETFRKGEITSVRDILRLVVNAAHLLRNGV